MSDRMVIECKPIPATRVDWYVDHPERCVNHQAVLRFFGVSETDSAGYLVFPSPVVVSMETA